MAETLVHPLASATIYSSSHHTPFRHPPAPLPNDAADNNILPPPGSSNASVIPPKKKEDKYYTPNEVSLHNSMDDLWISWLGNVYNLTALASEFRGKKKIQIHN